MKHKFLLALALTSVLSFGAASLSSCGNEEIQDTTRYKVNYTANDAIYKVEGLKSDGYLEGEKVEFTVSIVDTNYELNSVLKDGVALLKNGDNYTFTMGNKDVSIEVKTTLKDESFVKVIVQNLINKIWFRTDDLFTIEEAQKQLGREEKERISKSISESAKETSFSYITNTLNSQNSNISETYSTYLQNDFIYDTNFFTQNLQTFTALTFLSDGNKIYKPSKLEMYPYFK